MPVKLSVFFVPGHKTETGATKSADILQQLKGKLKRLILIQSEIGNIAATFYQLLLFVTTNALLFALFNTISYFLVNSLIRIL